MWTVNDSEAGDKAAGTAGRGGRDRKAQTQGVALQRYQNPRGGGGPRSPSLGLPAPHSLHPLHPHILPHPSTLLRARTFSSRTLRGRKYGTSE